MPRAVGRGDVQEGAAGGGQGAGEEGVGRADPTGGDQLGGPDRPVPSRQVLGHVGLRRLPEPGRPELEEGVDELADRRRGETRRQPGQVPDVLDGPRGRGEAAHLPGGPALEQVDAADGRRVGPRHERVDVGERGPDDRAGGELVGGPRDVLRVLDLTAAGRARARDGEWGLGDGHGCSSGLGLDDQEGSGRPQIRCPRATPHRPWSGDGPPTAVRVHP
ncbi:MAG: hypothetical protein AVDCRST_MAG48-3114 [uncultured Friedmanniella sp.]|uniref:Uncharacterized protein n=1 Tax=uncultured Friedmanniella sp. TaxID=335381 RepID=A0A6J4LFN8_9ACTN|nr:MAG: hypothetical protein AVDCRST_MAG48-3114 [uncultured Friedmanniella sp.]